MNLPDFPTLEPDVLQAVFARHDLAHLPLHRLPELGIFNAIFAVGNDLVFRIPRQHGAFVVAARKEALAGMANTIHHSAERSE